MSARERLKGAAAEREVIGLLHAYGWPHAERTSRGVAQVGKGDVAFGPEGCHLEIKRQERLSVPAAFDQLLRDANPLDIPILVHRPSRHSWMATTSLTDFLPLLALRERG